MADGKGSITKFDLNGITKEAIKACPERDNNQSCRNLLPEKNDRKKKNIYILGANPKL